MSRPPAPDLCQPALALRLLVASQVLAAAVVTLAAPDGQWLAAQAAAGLTVLGASLVWLVGLCAARRPLDRLPLPGRRALALAWGGLCAWGGLQAAAWLGLVVPDLRIEGGAVACGLLAAWAAWSWVEQRGRLQVPAQMQARLAELQSRIRPHFLFNALNAALALLRVDPDRAERVLEDLSALFRQVLAEEGAVVSLATEIELARRYLDIEQVRFGDRLRVTWDLDVPAGAARVPPLVLQPLVENAVKHGVEPALDGGEVTISTQVWQGLVRIVVSNSVPEGPARPGSGMALANVEQRLKLLHDLAAHVEAGMEPGFTASGPGGHGVAAGPRFVARLTVPL